MKDFLLNLLGSFTGLMIVFCIAILPVMNHIKKSTVRIPDDCIMVTWSNGPKGNSVYINEEGIKDNKLLSSKVQYKYAFPVCVLGEE